MRKRVSYAVYGGGDGVLLKQFDNKLEAVIYARSRLGDVGFVADDPVTVVKLTQFPREFGPREEVMAEFDGRGFRHA